MQNENIFDTPEIKKLFGEIYDKMMDESHRGAILIATSYIETAITELIEVILPEKSNSYKNKLLKYPGALSTFYSKIGLLYAFRIITKDMYDSLDSLRRLRNDAAHSDSIFSLNEFSNLLDDSINWGKNYKQVIVSYAESISNRLLMKAMKRKYEDKNHIFFNDNTSEESILAFIELAKANNIIKNEFNNKLQYYKLILGVVFFKHSIDILKKGVAESLTNDKLWSGLNLNLNLSTSSNIKEEPKLSEMIVDDSYSKIIDAIKSFDIN